MIEIELTQVSLQPRRSRLWLIVELPLLMLLLVVFLVPLLGALLAVLVVVAVQRLYSLLPDRRARPPKL